MTDKIRFFCHIYIYIYELLGPVCLQYIRMAPVHTKVIIKMLIVFENIIFHGQKLAHHLYCVKGKDRILSMKSVASNEKKEDLQGGDYNT